MKKTIMLAIAVLVSASAVYALELEHMSVEDIVKMEQESLAVPAPKAVTVKPSVKTPGVYASLIGQYELVSKEAGNCFGRIEIIKEAFLNSETGRNLSIYGLPSGEGLIVAQVLDINAGIKFDRCENPMVILPFQSGFLGYQPREATFSGNKLVYKTGELSMYRPESIKNGEIVEVELSEGGLKVRAGNFNQAGVTFMDSCAYKKLP